MADKIEQKFKELKEEFLSNENNFYESLNCAKQIFEYGKKCNVKTGTVETLYDMIVELMSIHSITFKEFEEKMKKQIDFFKK